MATADQIIAETAPAVLIDHNLIDKDVESLCDGMVQYEKRPAKRRDGSVVEGLYNAWIIFIPIAHGYLYIVYILTVLQIGVQKRMKFVTIIALIAAGTLPVASFIAERRIAKKYGPAR